MSTSDRQGKPLDRSDSPSAAAPAGAAGPAHNPYARFIPREELGNFAAWAPQTLEKGPAIQPDVGVRKPTLAERAAAEMRSTKPQQPSRPAPTSAEQAKAAVRRPVVGGMPGQAEAQEREAIRAAEARAGQSTLSLEEQLSQARQQGYQDGYRNGLAALESYKQTQAAQMAAYMSDQVGALASDFHHRLESLEQQLAGRISGVALELARQVVRTELRQAPELIVDVAEHAMGVLLASARQIIVRLNPEDHALAQAQLSEMLAARGARLVPDATVQRGGCIVESDIAVVDATVEARWARAAAALGYEAPWHDGHEATDPADAHPMVSDEDEDGEEPLRPAAAQPEAKP